ncbi:MAG: type II 3-dehydroquinate dehydratase [Micavibrio sp.]|nr:type II 3-dehydroquinate dehydratase [Micavibrio sp.]
MKKVFILNGPNLNMLGLREPELYGSQTLKDVEKLCTDAAAKLGMIIEFHQSNHEGQLIDWIQGAHGNFDALIINAAAYTHTSLAIHDALKILDIPIAEVHITDPKKREEFRHFSYIEPLANVHISGQGVQGYVLALEKLAKLL